jgi:outer membrane protein X
MKKLFLTMLVVLMSVSAIAQDKKYGVGINLLYGTEIKNIGFGVKGQYYATDAVRLEANAAFYPKKDEMKMFDVHVAGHYLIPIGQTMHIYPIAGAGITDWVHSAFDAKVKFTINLGGGFQFDVAEDFAVTAEVKYQIIQNYNQAVFGIGAVYKF